jgi:hypothetical protein
VRHDARHDIVQDLVFLLVASDYYYWHDYS